jgi:hypothetical protein
MYRLVGTVAKMIAAGDWQGLRQGCRRVFFRQRMTMRRVDLASVDDLTTLGLSHERSQGHSSSGGPELEDIFKTLRIKPEDAIIDFGSGKGGAIITFTKFPFSKISGVELSLELIRIAKENFRRLNINGVELFHADATQFTELDDYNHFYFLHPFPRNIMKSVIGNIVNSLERKPRDATIIYNHPKHRDVVETELCFEKTAEFSIGSSPRHQCVVYVHRTGASSPSIQLGKLRERK